MCNGLFLVLILLVSNRGFSIEKEEMPYAEIKCDSVPIQFYKKKDLSSKPAFVLTNKGIFRGDERICWWVNLNEKGTCDWNSTLQCFSDFPFYITQLEPGGMDYNRLIVKSEKGPIAEIEYEGHPYFFDVSKNKNISMRGSPANQKRKLRKSAELFLKQDPEFNRLRSGLSKCLESSKLVCLSKFIQIPFHANISVCDFDPDWPIISNQKNLKKCMTDIKHLIFPCLKAEADEITVVQGDAIEITDSDRYGCTFYRDRKDKKKWRLAMFSEPD